MLSIIHEQAFDVEESVCVSKTGPHQADACRWGITSVSVLGYHSLKVLFDDNESLSIG